MSSYRIREFDACDTGEVVGLWNLCLARDEVSLTTFRRKVVLDTNLDPRGCFVAEQGGAIIGFMLGIRRLYPFYDLGMEDGRGWLSAFYVHPDRRRQGAGTALLSHAEGFMRANGVTELRVADYTPNYFMPGVDLDAYEDSFEFLQGHGFRTERKVYGMGTSLLDFAVPPDKEDKFLRLQLGGITVRVFEPSLTLKVLAFLRKNYPGDLFHVAHGRLMEDPECDEILVAMKDGAVIGFSHFLDERFGPFGIAPEFAGRGIGPMLYYATVAQMRKKGKKNLWLAWTTGRAKDFYYHVGLRVVRRHAIMRKML